jgi:hypothetical protein
MFCKDCGAEIPNDSSFCLKCGKPQKGAIESHTEGWEYCEIVYEGKKKGIEGVLNLLFVSYSPDSHIRFWASASGPNGTYGAGSTDWFRGSYPNNKRHSGPFYRLKNTLLQEGWEQTGGGMTWWNDKFRRRVKSSKVI